MIKNNQSGNNLYNQIRKQNAQDHLNRVEDTIHIGSWKIREAIQVVQDTFSELRMIIRRQNLTRAQKEGLFAICNAREQMELTKARRGQGMAEYRWNKVRERK